MSMQTEVQILDGTPTSVWNGSEWVPYVDPRELRPFVLDRRSDRRVLLPLVAFVVALGLVLGGAGFAAVSHAGVVGDPGMTVVGTVDLVDLGTATRDCVGTGDYADIAAGTPVTLTDESGAVLATTTLERPTAFGDAGCIYPFTLAHVPTSYDKYVVVLPHGEKTLASRIALEANDWTFHLSLERAPSAA
jgi:hypothetical protein